MQQNFLTNIRLTWSENWTSETPKPISKSLELRKQNHAIKIEGLAKNYKSLWLANILTMYCQNCDQDCRGIVHIIHWLYGAVGKTKVVSRCLKFALRMTTACKGHIYKATDTGTFLETALASWLSDGRLDGPVIKMRMQSCCCVGMEVEEIQRFVLPAALANLQNLLSGL